MIIVADYMGCAHLAGAFPESSLEESWKFLLIVVLVVFLFGGGGYYGYRRWR